MIATCTNCASKFRVDDNKLGPRGAKVKCSHCGTTFIVRPEVSADAEVRVGEAPAPTPMPPEPTPLPLREMPLEFTPAQSSIPAATALAPPLPGPTRRALPDTSRFDLPPAQAPAPMTSELTPPPRPRPLPRPALPVAAAPVAPAPVDLSIGAAFDEGVMELDSANDFETTSPGFEPATGSLDLPSGPLELDTGPEMMPPPPDSDSLLDLAGPGFAPNEARSDTEETKPSIDVSALREPPPTAQDLFEASFASPIAPPPVADEPTREMPIPQGTPSNPLTDMPSFDEPPEMLSGPFAGGMSQDGIVTKSVDVSALRATMQGKPVASIALDRADLRDAAAENLVEPPPRAGGRRGGPLVIVTAGLVLVVALGLLAAYFAGGWQGLSEPKPTAQGLSVDEMRVIPYATRDGSRFWIVRGRLKNRGHSEQATRVEVTGGGSSVSTDLGLALDPLALYTRGDVAFVGTPLPSLAPGASAEFSVALSAGAVPDASALQAQAIPR